MDAERDAVVSRLRDYIRTFETGTRDDLQAFCQLPVAYVTDREVQLRERYPFDPEKLRAQTNLAHSEMRIDVLHLDAHRAHVALEGTRQRSDGSIIEGVEAIYFLHRIDGEWKITLISGIRKDP